MCDCELVTNDTELSPRLGASARRSVMRVRPFLAYVLVVLQQHMHVRREVRKSISLRNGTGCHSQRGV